MLGLCSGPGRAAPAHQHPQGWVKPHVPLPGPPSSLASPQPPQVLGDGPSQSCLQRTYSKGTCVPHLWAWSGTHLRLRIKPVYSLLTPSRCQIIGLNRVVTGWPGVPAEAPPSLGSPTPTQASAGLVLLHLSVSFCVLPPPHLRLFLEPWDLFTILASFTSTPVRRIPIPSLPKYAVMCSLEVPC